MAFFSRHSKIRAGIKPLSHGRRNFTFFAKKKAGAVHIKAAYVRKLSNIE